MCPRFLKSVFGVPEFEVLVDVVDKHEDAFLGERFGRRHGREPEGCARRGNGMGPVAAIGEAPNSSKVRCGYNSKAAQCRPPKSRDCCRIRRLGLFAGGASNGKQRHFVVGVREAVARRQRLRRKKRLPVRAGGSQVEKRRPWQIDRRYGRVVRCVLTRVKEMQTHRQLRHRTGGGRGLAGVGVRRNVLSSIRLAIGGCCFGDVVFPLIFCGWG